jgi:hypothetical protein
VKRAQAGTSAHLDIVAIGEQVRHRSHRIGGGRRLPFRVEAGGREGCDRIELGLPDRMSFICQVQSRSTGVDQASQFTPERWVAHWVVLSRAVL